MISIYTDPIHIFFTIDVTIIGRPLPGWRLHRPRARLCPEAPQRGRGSFQAVNDGIHGRYGTGKVVGNPLNSDF